MESFRWVLSDAQIDVTGIPEYPQRIFETIRVVNGCWLILNLYR